MRINYAIPAIAYGVIKNNTVLVQNAIGYGDIKLNTEAKVNDLFHIGSNTKSFTSFLAGRVVEMDKISWDTKFFDLYPEMRPESNSKYEAISLKELLSHRARLIQFKDDSEVYPIIDYEKDLATGLNIAEKRYHFIKQALKYEPIPVYEHPDDRYSNDGYIAAALMLEKATGQTWEELIPLPDELKNSII